MFIEIISNLRDNPPCGSQESDALSQDWGDVNTGGGTHCKAFVLPLRSRHRVDVLDASDQPVRK